MSFASVIDTMTKAMPIFTGVLGATSNLLNRSPQTANATMTNFQTQQVNPSFTWPTVKIPQISVGGGEPERKPADNTMLYVGGAALLAMLMMGKK